MDATNIWGISGNWAEIYHSCFVPTIIAPWVARTLALAAPRPGERLLDVACGTGAVTRPAAQIVGPTGQVVGLDLNPEALAAARSVDGQEGGATIEWREGSAESLPFADGSFDVVTCQFGAMFFPDRVAALREMRRVVALALLALFLCGFGPPALLDNDQRPICAGLRCGCAEGADPARRK